MFKDCDKPVFNPSEYKELSYEYNEKEFWKRYKDYYTVFHYSNNVLWNSTVCLGSKDNIVKPAIDTINELFNSYRYQGMAWTKGYRSELIIKRVSRNFKTVMQGSQGDKNFIIIERM